MELYIPEERRYTNAVNGQFLPGHVPHNKGKKWKDYLDAKTRRKIRYLLRKKCPHRGNPSICGWNAKPIYALDDEGNVMGWFASSEDADRKTGICARNIRSVLEGKRKHAGGYRWELA